MARQYMKVVGVGGGRGPRPVIRTVRGGRGPNIYRATSQLLAKAKTANG